MNWITDFEKRGNKGLGLVGTVIKTGCVFFAAVPLGNLARALAISQLFLALMNHLEVQDIRLLRGNLVTTTPFDLIPPFTSAVGPGKIFIN